MELLKNMCAFNSNMGCIEIKPWSCSYGNADEFNSNMGCIEILLLYLY